MNDEREWLSEAAGRKVHATELADVLGVSRNTMNKKLARGLRADEVIEIARHLGLGVIDALVELECLTYKEAHDFLEGAGKLIGTATEGELAIELAQRLNTVRELRDALGPKPRHLTSLDPAEHLDAAAKPGEVVRGDPDDFEA